jgi:hypothetical protein
VQHTRGVRLLISASVVLITVALIVRYIPVRWALRVDPAVALNTNRREQRVSVRYHCNLRTAGHVGYFARMEPTGVSAAHCVPNRNTAKPRSSDRLADSSLLVDRSSGPQRPE